MSIDERRNKLEQARERLMQIDPEKRRQQMLKFIIKMRRIGKSTH